VSTIMFF